MICFTKNSLKCVFLVASILGTLAVVDRPTAVSAASTTISGRVFFNQQDCRGDTSERMPLSGAKVILQPKKGSTVKTVLGDDGSFKGSVPGTSPVEVLVQLSGKRIDVAPDPGTPGPPPEGEELESYRAYKLSLGRFDRGNPRTVVLNGNKNGAANIWTVMNEAAETAAKASPVPIPKVPVFWVFDAFLHDFVPRQGSSYDSTGPAIYVGHGDLGGHDEWEAWPLAHEYGHHVLQQVAPTGETDTDHGLATNERALPATSWSEGFAHLFAAVVLDQKSAQPLAEERSPKLVVGCDKGFLDLASKPATSDPALSDADARYAQYNEARTAGAFWHVMRLVSPTDSAAAMKKLLSSLKAYRDLAGGRSPDTTREVRDALIVGGIEDQTPEGHEEIDEIFRDQGINWALSVSMNQMSFTGGGCPECWPEVTPEGDLALRLTGPYGTCEWPGDADSDFIERPPNDHPFDGLAPVEGGLPYAWHDDCMLRTHSRNASFPSYLQLAFPYLADQSHLDDASDDFTLTATYICPPNTECASTITWRIQVRHRNFIGCFANRQGCGTGPEPTEWYTSTAQVTMSVGQTVDVVRFDARMECLLLPTNEDCSV